MAKKKSETTTTDYKYDRMFEQNEANEKYNWEASQPYIHYHEENARKAAGGLSLAAIRANALSSAKVAAIERYNKSIYAGNTSPEALKKFDNEVTDINAAVSNTAEITNILDEIVQKAADYRSKGVSANQLSGKIATAIGSVNSSSRSKMIDLINEVLEIMYDKNLHQLIQSLQKQKKLTTIKQDQLASLQKLEGIIQSGEWNRGIKTSVRNTLVDIFTEQGLPDFVQGCLDSLEEEAAFTIESALQFGKVRVAEGHQKGGQGKIDTMMTFIMPDGRKITQGISLKSNWAGYHASILSTSIRSTLNYANQGNQYAMANAVSLFTSTDELKAWMEWSNVDRALQGTMAALQNGLQDRADMLIEFTSRGLQVFNINYMMYRLLQKIKSMNNVPLTAMGFGMSDRYGMNVSVYDRSKFTQGNIATLIQQRSAYTSQWLSQTHAVTLNAEAMMTALA